MEKVGDGDGFDGSGNERDGCAIAGFGTFGWCCGWRALGVLVHLLLLVFNDEFMIGKLPRVFGCLTLEFGIMLVCNYNPLMMFFFMCMSMLQPSMSFRVVVSY